MSYLLYEIGQNFFDIQYMNDSANYRNMCTEGLKEKI